MQEREKEQPKEEEKPQPAKWPFDPIQQGDHEPVRRTDDETVKPQQHPDRRRARSAAAINIETYRGVVQLTGFVSSPDQAQRAAAAAKKVEGVREVKNDVRVKPSS
jgi:hypothetical protein